MPIKRELSTNRKNVTILFLRAGDYNDFPKNITNLDLQLVAITLNALSMSEGTKTCMAMS